MRAVFRLVVPDVLDHHRRDPPGLGRLRQHRLELGEDDVEFVDTQDAVLARIVTLVVGTGHERRDEGVGDLAGVLVGGPLGEAGPRLGHLALAEAVVAQRLPPDGVDHRLLALFPQQREELLGLPQHVGVVGAAQPAVRRHHQHTRPLGVLPLDEQRVIQRAGTRKLGEHVGDLGGVGPSRLDSGLRLGDSRRRDQLLGLGDLLDRPGGADASAQLAQCGCHVVAYLLLRCRLADLDRFLLDVLFVHRLGLGLVDDHGAAVGGGEALLEVVDDLGQLLLGLLGELLGLPDVLEDVLVAGLARARGTRASKR